MAATQLVIVTPVPASLQLDPDTIHVSVLFSPRLRGEETLGAFPDWLGWTRKLADGGLDIRFECGGQSLTVPTDTSGLRPDLWEALFNRDTYVRSHVYDDYSESFVPSYSNRLALGLIQAAYQEAAVELAVPPAYGDSRETLQVQRGRLRDLLEDFAVQWDSRSGPAMRARARDRQARQRHLLASSMTGGPGGPGATTLDPSGLIPTGALQPGSAAWQGVASTVTEDFSVFAHQPQGADVTEDSLDREHVLDFHQALSSVNGYHQLQRDLGLVFDLELPREFVADSVGNTPGELAITGVGVSWNADVPTEVPPTRVAYLHQDVDGDRRLFCVAPLAVKGPRPLLIGMLDLEARYFGVAQVDVDGALHKTLMHAGNLDRLPGESMLPTADVNDPYTALNSLRSGGISLFADSRALVMLDTFDRGKQHNADLEAGQPQQDAFHAEDLTRGYRLDIWDSVTGEWHSLHRRDMTVHVGADDLRVESRDDEGFFQAAMTQAAPEADGSRANTDLHLHEAMARWSGWSLSAPSVGTHLTRAGNPEDALPKADDPDPENEAVTPFQLTSDVTHVKGSLPRLRFGVGYRLRVRAVDLATNGLNVDDEECRLFTPLFSMPPGDGMIPYLRYEPVVPPVLVARDVAAVGDGSRVDRLVVRTFNDTVGKDADAAVGDASDRHVAPPGVPVEMAERHGMLDDATGGINPSPDMWQLVADRDLGHFPAVKVPGMEIDGEEQTIQVDPADEVAELPYLPDPLARAAAFRDLPGTTGDAIGRVAPGPGASAEVDYTPLDDPQPRPGTATIVEYGGRDDWQGVLPFRLAVGDGDGPPVWDPAKRVLTVALPKGTTHVVPVSSCCDADDLKTLGIWAWLREYVENRTLAGDGVESAFNESAAGRDRLAHVLQLAAEGGHRMLTPPRLLTLVSAVQQPIGHPAFGRLNAQLRLVKTEDEQWATTLRTEPEVAPTAETEGAVLTGWREPGGTDAYLVGALQVHGASTAKVDLHAEWSDPYDDPVGEPDGGPGEKTFSMAVEEIPLPDLRPRRFWWSDDTLREPGGSRAVGHYVREHDIIAFAPLGTKLGNKPEGEELHEDAVPRHRIGDSRHHVVTYRAVAASRYAEYFPQDEDLDFTRTSPPVVVDIPASSRPVAPLVRYVVPTFGWERARTANQVRSVRTGGGLRIYLDRPWWSSGAGELLGVTLADDADIDRELWKGSVTQWGEDPIHESSPLPAFPDLSSFPDAVTTEQRLTLDTTDRIAIGFVEIDVPRRVDVAGHEVAWDPDRKLWYCDISIDTDSLTYAPFVRLALARYQPHALEDAKLSRVVLADFAQLTAERALTVTADPFTPRALEVTVSGPAPTGPRPNKIRVTVQRQDPGLDGVDTDLGWETAADMTVTEAGPDPLDPPRPEFVLWHGRVALSEGAVSGTGRYRLLVEEVETYRIDGARRPVRRGGVVAAVPVGERLVYAETVSLDPALLAPPGYPASSTSV